MKKLLILPFLFLPLFAFCAAIPKGSVYDKRIQSVKFNLGDVTKINLTDGIVSSIVFSQSETVLDVVSGFTDGFEFRISSNILYIKPKNFISNGEMMRPTSEWSTNLLVTTNNGLYAFDLSLINTKKSVSYVVYVSPKKTEETSNNEDEKTKKPQAMGNQPESIKRYDGSKSETKKSVNKTERDEKKTDEENEQTTDNFEDELMNWKMPLNWNYKMKMANDSESIRPVFVYDDGTFTYIGFNKNNTFPSVYSLDDEGETILNTHVKYDHDYQVLVVQRLSKILTLRSGQKLIGIYNMNKGNGTTNYETTSSSELKRVEK